jgi:hypothetical protein
MILLTTFCSFVVAGATVYIAMGITSIGIFGVSLSGFMTFMVNFVGVSAAAATALGVIIGVTHKPKRLWKRIPKSLGDSQK